MHNNAYVAPRQAFEAPQATEFEIDLTYDLDSGDMDGCFSASSSHPAPIAVTIVAEASKRANGVRVEVRITKAPIHIVYDQAEVAVKKGEGSTASNCDCDPDSNHNCDCNRILTVTATVVLILMPTFMINITLTLKLNLSLMLTVMQALCLNPRHKPLSPKPKP